MGHLKLHFLINNYYTLYYLSYLVMSLSKWQPFKPNSRPHRRCKKVWLFSFAANVQPSELQYWGEELVHVVFLILYMYVSVLFGFLRQTGALLWCHCLHCGLPAEGILGSKTFPCLCSSIASFFPPRFTNKNMQVRLIGISKLLCLGCLSLYLRPECRVSADGWMVGCLLSI